MTGDALIRYLELSFLYIYDSFCCPVGILQILFITLKIERQTNKFDVTFCVAHEYILQFSGFEKNESHFDHFWFKKMCCVICDEMLAHFVKYLPPLINL